MAVTLKEETILQRWAQLVTNAAPHAYDVLEDVQSHLRDAEIPGKCEWSVEEVQQKEGLFSKTKREFLIVKLEQFKDYRIYVSARAYGKSLDCCWFLTVEPGFFKKMVAGKLADGDWSAMSAPKNILLEQDLKAWTTTVHLAVRGAMESLFDRLQRPKNEITRESQGVMSIA
ncbi:hypothetical protein K8I85_10015 [bacterium]|nr:hypothetical protein [bacterium]